MASWFTTYPLYNLKATELYSTMICKVPGYPKTIISYSDIISLSKFWKTLFILNGTKLGMNTSYQHKLMDKLRSLIRDYLIILCA